MWGGACLELADAVEKLKTIVDLPNHISRDKSGIKANKKVAFRNLDLGLQC